METFNIVAGICSVAGFVFAIAAWVYERLKTKRMRPMKEESRVTYWWTRL